MRLPREFYRQNAYDLAPQLLGKVICRRINGSIMRFSITETECYYGESDTACHAHKGRTPRTETLYRDGGTAYVYLCYGIHNLLNVVSGREGSPQAVLIRGIKGFPGPGRLTKHMQIDRTHNGIDLVNSDEIWLEATENGAVSSYITTPRIGIQYASPEDQARPWRFLLKTLD